tara:strand:- start:634 stop:1743 length:1110 start_codon:yes stop_codon:yes gene_type:complete
MKNFKVYFFTLILIISSKGIVFSSSQYDSLKIKISQMLIFGIQDAKKVLEEDSLLEAYSNTHLGGIILFEKNISKKRSKVHLKALIEEIQSISKIPSFIAIDEEGGKVNRLKPIYGFHQTKSAKYLGDVNNLDSTYYYAELTSELLKELGINVNFAPVVDLALNTSNFIYNAERSFGKDSDRVFFHARNVINAHKENDIITVLKHFPGHGSSTTDTHKEFTDVSNSWIVEELFPYHKLMIEDKVDGVMTSHVVNSKIDDSLLPATLSEKSINKLLREFLDYEGVVFSDDMQMGAITKNYGLKEAITYAINAGVDVLIFSNNQLYKDLVKPDKVISIIEEGVNSGDISLLRINESFRRIQNLKKKINLIK